MNRNRRLYNFNNMYYINGDHKSDEELLFEKEKDKIGNNP